MKIVILDSCSSGAITRAKGGVKTQPFLFDSSVSAAGFAFLTSSSEDEASQESDSIGSSYFTHSILAGLRGAADSVGDGRVTLNELYRYAYTETLAKTETSMYGPQHPSYDIQISGSGDVVLTDIKEISASLVILDDVNGRISIRDGSDFLVAELTKMSGRPLVLGLEPGLYRITLQKGNNFFKAEVMLYDNRQASLGSPDFSMIAAATGGRIRGDEDSENDDDLQPFSFQFLPGIDGSGQYAEQKTYNFLLGLFVGLGHNIKGLGLANIGLINTGYIQGIQLSGIFNIADGFVEGLQAAGIFNIARSSVKGIQNSGIFNIASGNVKGLQISGIFNYAENEVFGLQASSLYNETKELHGMQTALVNINKSGEGAMLGLVNVSGSDNIVPFGLVNIIKGGIMHPAVYFDDMLFTNASFRSGSKYFYSVLSTGIGGGYAFGSGDKMLSAKAGFGVEFPANKFFFNVDISAGTIMNMDTVNEKEDAGKGKNGVAGAVTNVSQLRLTAGYKFFPNLGVFAGASLDYFQREYDSCPDPRDFGGILAGKNVDRNIYKLGFFGGVQF
jgi:hypothetical protein